MPICQYLLNMGNENNNKYENFTKNNSPQKTNKNITKDNSSQNESQNFPKDNRTFQQKKPTRFPTLFQWDGEGNNVYLTGSFCDWQQFFEMERCEDPNNKNTKFYITLFLPLGSYQYKFKIDEQWKCNSNFPTCRDKNGNINNIIDLTKLKREEGITDFSTSYFTTGGPEQKFNEMKYSKNSNSIQTTENNYNFNSDNLFIAKSGFQNLSENSSFKCNYENDLNDYILNKNNFDKEEINNLYDNLYKKAFPLRHEHIDHLIAKFNSFIKNCNNNKNLVNSCSFRYGFKTTTIIYYKPKLKKG